MIYPRHPIHSTDKESLKLTLKIARHPLFILSYFTSDRRPISHLLSKEGRKKIISITRTDILTLRNSFLVIRYKLSTQLLF